MSERALTTPAAGLVGLDLDASAAEVTVTTNPHLTEATVTVSGPSETVDATTERRTSGTWVVRLPRQSGTTVVTTRRGGSTVSMSSVSGGTVVVGGNVTMVNGQVVSGGEVVTVEPVTVHVSLPERADLTTDTTSGSVDAHGAYGTVRHESSSGNLYVGTAERVDANSSSGDMRIGQATNQIEASASSGDITVDASAPHTRVRASSGDVTIRVAGDHEVRARASSGDVTVYRNGYSGADIRTRTSSGQERVI